MSISQKPLVQQLKELVKCGCTQEALDLLATVEAWPANTLESALVEASQGEDLTLITALMDAGASPNGVGGGGYGLLTPLHLAARQRNPALIDLLLARGAEVNVLYSESGATPLHEVLGRGYDEDAHLPLVRRLLEAGADPNRQASATSKQTDLTPLQRALKYEAEATALLLLDYGADLDQRNGDLRTALEIATQQAVRSGDLTWVAWLLAQGADPNAGEAYNTTPLTFAARAGRVGLIDYLVEAGADVRRGYPLAFAADQGHLEVARRLLALGADVNETDVFDTTGLISAITSHDTAMVKLLMDHGAPVDQPTKTYKGEMTPLAFARESPHHNADIIAYMLASIAAHDAERARREAGIYYAAGLVNVARDPRVGKPVLHWLEEGADPNSRNVFGRTALHYLAERGYPLEEVELLLIAGADPNARDPFGYAPLHDAVLGDDAGIIQVLLDAGVDPGARVACGIHTGYSALEIARIERRETAVRLLTPISPAPRPLTPCEPEFRRDGSVKGFSHYHYEVDVVKNAESRDVYMREAGKRRRWAERGGAKPYAEPCVCVHRHQFMSEYRGTGIPRAEHPLRWRIAMAACLHCGSEDVMVIYAGWGVQPHDGDLVWSYEVHCDDCGYYSSWGYDEG